MRNERVACICLGADAGRLVHHVAPRPQVHFVVRIFDSEEDVLPAYSVRQFLASTVTVLTQGLQVMTVEYVDDLTLIENMESMAFVLRCTSQMLRAMGPKQNSRHTRPRASVPRGSEGQF